MPFCFSAILVCAAGVRRSAAFAHRLVVFLLAVTATARFFTTTVHFVDSSPGSALRFVLWNAPVLVALFYVLRLSLLFFRVFGFVPAWHRFLLIDPYQVVHMVYRQGSNSASEWQRLARVCIFSA